MVIVRCIGPDEFFLERVVFPFELLSFLAPPDSVVQIWTHGLGGAELRESLSVNDLCMDELISEPGMAEASDGVSALHQNEPAWQQAS
ncbi:MAG: hypothetical protein RLZZ631_427 [Cyanobacteriota bacterium]